MPGEFDPLCNPKPQSQKKTIKTATQLRKEGWDQMGRGKNVERGKIQIVRNVVNTCLPPSLPSPTPQVSSLSGKCHGDEGDAEIEPFKGDKIY